MKHQWTIQRWSIESPDAQRRWDQAYQCLLRWDRETTLIPIAEFLIGFTVPQEVANENRNLCARVDATPSPDPND